MNGQGIKTTICLSWAEITSAFDDLIPPHRGFDVNGGLLEYGAWVFRGHKTAYSLAPSVEREAEELRLSWAALESELLREFQAKARLHIPVHHLPASDDEKLGWLALMQHHGVPTRLLDFSSSPYVALYFAIRDRSPEERLKPAEVWAIDRAAVDADALRNSRAADREMEREYNVERHRVSLDPRLANSDRDVLNNEQGQWNKVLSHALTPEKRRRSHFEHTGLVVSAQPPAENQRLSSQQGLFLFSAAENMTFSESLNKMMASAVEEWCQKFQIAEELIPEAEARLFQMNVHDLSLFPDVEGLAGFVRQKARLRWRYM